MRHVCHLFLLHPLDINGIPLERVLLHLLVHLDGQDAIVHIMHLLIRGAQPVHLVIPQVLGAILPLAHTKQILMQIEKMKKWRY